MENSLIALSQQLAETVEQAAPSILAIQGGARVPASGVLWGPDIVVTADHMIRREEDLHVTAPDGKTLPAELVGRDPSTDLALLRVAGLEGAGLARIESMQRPGQVVLVLGRSPETGVQASMGIISSVSGPWHTWRGGRIDCLLRLDVSLYPGSSGGAVIDASGRLVGIATGGLSRTSAIAIPLATIQRITAQLLEQGHIRRGWLGIGLQPLGLPEHLMRKSGRDERGGVILLSVESGSPADQAGFLPGDILLTLDGKATREPEHVQELLTGDVIGRELQAVVLRGGMVMERAVKVAERNRKGER